MEKSLDSPRFNLFAPGCTLVVSQLIRLASSCALVGSGLILVITNLILGRTSSILGRTRSILVGFRFFLAAALVSSDSRKWVFSQIFNDRRKSGTWTFSSKRWKIIFFWKHDFWAFQKKIMIFGFFTFLTQIFSPRLQKMSFFHRFSTIVENLGLKIFVKKVKNYFFLKTWFLGVSEKNNDFWIFHFFDENFWSPSARWDSKNVRPKGEFFFSSENMIFGRFRKK